RRGCGEVADRALWARRNGSRGRRRQTPRTSGGLPATVEQVRRQVTAVAGSYPSVPPSRKRRRGLSPFGSLVEFVRIKLALTCRQKPQRRRSGGLRRSGAVRGSVPRGFADTPPRLRGSGGPRLWAVPWRDTLLLRILRCRRLHQGPYQCLVRRDP